MTEELRRSWLVQRLRKPRNFGPLGGNPFAFRGGLKNGGLSDEAMEIIGCVFGFDYMGAAEFEFGAVPKALHEIAKAADKGKLAAFPFDIALSAVEPNWRDRKSPAPDGSATVYVLCPRDWGAEVERRVREWAAKDHTMKEPTHLPNTLRPYSEWDGDTVGWLELDNGFFFFTDADMWARTCSIFGVEVSVTAGGAA